MKPSIEEYFEPIKRLSKDLRAAAKSLTIDEVRYLVDLYYQIQKIRIQAGGEIRAMSESTEPIEILDWVFVNQQRIERAIFSALDVYTKNESTGMGEWAREICGIGPVLSSGLLAHINLEPWRCAKSIAGKAKKPCQPEEACTPECKLIIVHTAGHIWRFAGLDPSSIWEAGKKRPWNADLKVICWKIGQSFMKVQANPKDVYGKLYAKRKALEQERNEQKLFADQAKNILASKRFRKTTEAYKHYSVGKLPPAHIDARARRYAVKIFLSHWHAEAYRRKFFKEPPLPYPIAHLGHAHLI